MIDILVVVCVVELCFLFLMIRRPPRSTRTDTLLPYTTLFRSEAIVEAVILEIVGGDLRRDSVQPIPVPRRVDGDVIDHAAGRAHALDGVGAEIGRAHV